MKRVVNFNPGPAALPLAALERAQRELLDFEGTGMSIMEHSHRAKDYERVHFEAIALLSELYALPDGYQVLLMQGGARAQFALIPLNFLPAGRSADYLVTGVWARQALAEAKTIGMARAAASTELPDGTFVRVPEPAEIDADQNAAYLHFCTNNTVMGTQFHYCPPSPGVPRVADMSSDILSEPLDVSQFDLIYAGAQKNLGPSGVTVVIARKAWLEAGRGDIPQIFQYREHARENSLLNTAPTFAIYMLRNVLDVMKQAGGLEAVSALNRQKGELVYDMLDAQPDFFRTSIEKASRSRMNVVFRLPTPELDAKMVAEAKEAGFVGIKGHRIVGGLRVSLYNAIRLEHVEQFVSWAKAFARQNA